METNEELRSFNQLYSDYQERFIRFANTYVHDWAIAEDFAADSLMYYWENRHRLSPETNIPAYVLTAIKNKCLNYLQHLRTHNDAIENLSDHFNWELSARITSLSACDPNELFTSEIRDILNRTLDKLPQKTKDIFIMSRDRNITQKEIAIIFNMTPKGVEFHISKATKILKKTLSDYLLFLTLLYYIR